MQKNYLREVVSIVVGKPAENIADILDNKKHVNEFIIAKKMDLTINQIRNLLYKLSDYGLVSSIRKKDKKKGWYTYFWKLEKIKCLDFLKNYLSKRIDQINSQIKSRETKQFYICERCKIEFNEENALLNDFTCNECGDIFKIKDNTKLIKELKKILTRLKKEGEFVKEETKKEGDKLEKAKEKIRKKEVKKKPAKKKIEKKIPKKKSVNKKVVKKAIKKSNKKKISKNKKK